MKKLILITCIFIATLATAQDQYRKGMQKAFTLWGEGKSVEAANLFERIAAADSSNWLPYYYVAQVNTLASFGLKDEIIVKQQLDKAQEYIDLATAISPNNAELLVQQAMLYTAWVAFDGATYGMALAPKVTAIYAKADSLDPNNPRVVFCKAEWDIGSAQYFGGDIKPYCEDVARAIELFDNFKPVSEFHPNWGKERAEETLVSCKK